MTDFNTFWKRWRGPVEGRLANENEGREEARIQWGKLSEPHRRLAHQWGPHFQREFKKANGDDCSMLHCCRYLSKKRFLNYEDMEPKEKIPEIIFNEHDPWKTQKEKVLKIIGPVQYAAFLKDMHTEVLYIIDRVNEPEPERFTFLFPSKFKADYVKNAWGATFEEIFQARVRFTVGRRNDAD